MQNEVRLLSKIMAVMMLAAALVGGASACASCGAGSASGWAGADSMGISWADELSKTTTSEETVSEGEGGEVGALSNEPLPSIAPSALYADQIGEKRMVMAYAGVPGEASFIEGSILLPLDQVFADNGTLKSPDEIALLLGAAGISEVDPLVIYGDNFVYQTFAFWVMKYLGHQDVVLLEGTRADHVAAGLEFVATPTPRAGAVYNPEPNLGLLTDALPADGQLVDARSPAEYAADHLDGAINIDSSAILDADGLLADDEALASAFSGLNQERPVVVYSSGKGGVASIVWYALYTHGYDASLATMESLS
ncbi:MAG TPA: rhodanese-like domain-containing protein [Methanothrix sp.]|nr:rhodanese-like domain-containing protein [Methanothrix sp.]